MNADEIQYALDRRNEVDITGAVEGTDNEIDRPIQLGHLTGKVIIKSSTWAPIRWVGPSGRHVFEYNYTGSQDPPRIYFEKIRSSNPGTGTYNTTGVGFFKVVQPGTAPKSIYIDHCNLSGTNTYLIDGSDVSYTECIQIKNSEIGGPNIIRWRIRDGEPSMHYFEINNTRLQGSSRVGPSTDLKNTRNIYWITYTDEQNSDLYSELVGNYEGPVVCRLVNPKGFNVFEHNWNEYGTDWDTESPNCWSTSIRVDETSGEYGMYYIQRYQTPLSWGGATDVYGVQFAAGHSSSNAGSLYNEQLDRFETGDGTYAEIFTGKMYPVIRDGWSVGVDTATRHTSLNASSLSLPGRLDVSSNYPKLYGNSRTPYWNTPERENRTSVIPQGRIYDEVLADQGRKAYGDTNSRSSLDGSDVVIKFYGSGVLTVTEEVDVEYLIIAGGGAGGAFETGTSWAGGGGGAGGFTSNFGGTKVTLSPGDYQVVVGAGGEAPEYGTGGDGGDGGDSSFNGITMAGGGGGGGSSDGATFSNGRSGGSGGGAAPLGGRTGGSSDAYGYDGGSSDQSEGSTSGGSGGGGAGGAGGAGSHAAYNVGGNGGIGVSNSITGSAQWYGEGGGGGVRSLGSNGTGGANTEGGWPSTTLEGYRVRDGAPNTGSGGAGGSTPQSGVPSYAGNGGSGVVIIRYAGS